MSFNITQNTTGYMNPEVSSTNQGWAISGGDAIHDSCNAGTIISLTSLGLVVGRAYVFKYTVKNYINGYVNIMAGGANGDHQTANGVYTQILTVLGTPQLSFYSNGTLTISDLSFYDELTGIQSGATISFNEKANRWTSEYSFQPEVMIKFLDQFLTIKNGQLWLHNSNPVYNNFYGVQYSSQIIFIANQEYLKNKLWFNIRMDSTGKWYVANMSTVPDDQFPNGMSTLMTSSNLKSIDGKLWGDILRDINDPNFANITDPDVRAATALFNGRLMQGGWLITNLQNNDTTQATIASCELYYIDVQKSL